MLRISACFFSFVLVAIAFPNLASAGDLERRKPVPDIVCRNVDDTYEIIESMTQDEDGKYTSPYSGKIVQVSNCWFDPLSSMYLERDKAKEGVYTIAFDQGGLNPRDGTRIGNSWFLYTKNQLINFFIEDGEDAQWLKDYESRIRDGYKKENFRRNPYRHCDLYFEIVDRKSKHGALTMPCAKLIYIQWRPTPDE